MKKLIYAIIPVALLFAGCEDACQKGFALKSDLGTLETTVTGTIGTPAAFDASCGQFRSRWNDELLKGSAFASRVATDYFYYEDSFCARSHYERRCYWDGYPRYPHYYCHSVVVCDYYQTTPHHRDGYDQAMNLASLLAGTEGELASACAAHERGADAEALLHLGSAKLKLHESQGDADQVLVKAGCYERRGD